MLVRAPWASSIPRPVRAAHCRAAIVKHTVPCGVAERATVAEAVRAALDADPISAYGGIIAVDGPIDLAAAEALGEFFLEIVAAPAFERRCAGALAAQEEPAHHAVRGRDAAADRARAARALRAGRRAGRRRRSGRRRGDAGSVVSQRAAEAGEWRDLIFAWDVVRHVKSNGVAVVRDAVSRGICAGQTNRVSAVRIAGERAGSFARGAACASDGFFPFADGLIAAADAGCSAVIAPSGSIRDAEVIAAADERGIALGLFELPLLLALRWGRSPGSSSA